MQNMGRTFMFYMLSELNNGKLRPQEEVVVRKYPARASFAQKYLAAALAFFLFISQKIMQLIAKLLIDFPCVGDGENLFMM